MIFQGHKIVAAVWLIKKGCPNKFAVHCTVGKYAFFVAIYCLKIPQNVAFDLLNFGFFHHFCPIKN